MTANKGFIMSVPISVFGHDGYRLGAHGLEAPRPLFHERPGVPDGDELRGAAGRDEPRGRERLNVSLGRHESVVEQRRDREPPRDHPRFQFGQILVVRNREYGDGTIVLVLVVELLEFGHFGHAWTAPRAPEVHHCESVSERIA